MKKLLTTCAIVSLSAFPALAAQDNMDASKEGKPLSTQAGELQTDTEPTGSIAEGEYLETQERKEGEPATADGDLVDRSMEPTGEVAEGEAEVSVNKQGAPKDEQPVIE